MVGHPSFSITAIHQIEMTSRCNLRCKYCPSPNLGRDKMDMSREHYELSLRWAKYFVAKGTQRELNIVGIGESTLHPNFIEWTALARETIGDIPLVITTNGLLFTDELAKAIAPYRPSVFVSLHRPEKAGHAIEAAKKYGLLAGASADPSLSAIDWAGQVKWFNSAGTRECMWVKYGRVMVMADGRITSCCLDASGSGIIGSIEDDVLQLKTAPYVLCGTCDQRLNINGYTQEKRVV